MDDMQIRLSLIWIAVMLTYLLGDVIRMFSGDFTPGKLEGVEATQAMWLGIAALMVIPIVMVVLCLVLDQPINRWANIIAGIITLVYITAGGSWDSPSYLVFMTIEIIALVYIIWSAWTWRMPEPS